MAEEAWRIEEGGIGDDGANDGRLTIPPPPPPMTLDANVMPGSARVASFLPSEGEEGGSNTNDNPFLATGPGDGVGGDGGTYAKNVPPLVGGTTKMDGMFNMLGRKKVGGIDQGDGAGIVGKGVLPFANKSPSLEPSPIKGVEPLGIGVEGGVGVGGGSGGAFVAKGGFPMPLKGKESASSMNAKIGIGKGVLPFVKKSPSLEASPTKVVGSFGGGAGVGSGGVFMSKKDIVGGFPSPPKGKESSSPMYVKGGITSGDGNFVSGLKKTIGVSNEGVSKGVLPFMKKSPSLEASPEKVVGSFGGGAGVGSGGLFMYKNDIEGGFPSPPKGKESSSPMVVKSGITSGGGNYLSGLKKTIGVSNEGVGKGVLPFMKKSSSLEASPEKVVGSFGGGAGVGSGGVFMYKNDIEGGFPSPPKGKESSSPMDVKSGITSGGGNYLSGLKKTIAVSNEGVGKGVLPFMKKSSSLEASPEKVVGSFGGGAGVGSGGVFMYKNDIEGGFPSPPKGKESSSPMDVKSGITSGGGNYLSGLKKTIGISSDGINENESFLPLKGFIGKGYPLSLKFSSSPKRDDDISEQVDDESTTPTLIEPNVRSMISPPSLPDNTSKGAPVFTGIGMKTPHMVGPTKTNSFLESLSKGQKFEGKKSENNVNSVVPSKSSLYESLNKRNSVALKARSESGITFPMKDSFTKPFSKGNLGKMKTDGRPLPLPPLKGMQVSSGANVGTGLPFMKKFIPSEKDGAEEASLPATGKMETSINKLKVVDKTGSGFMKSSSFNGISSKGFEPLGSKTFQAKIDGDGYNGDGSFPSLKGIVSLEKKSSSFLSGLKESSKASYDVDGSPAKSDGSSIEKSANNIDIGKSSGTMPMKDSFTKSFSKGNLGEMKAKDGALPLTPPLKGMQVSSKGSVGTGLSFMKKLIISNKDAPLTEGLTAEEAEGVRIARLDDADAFVESLKRTPSTPTSIMATAAMKPGTKAADGDSALSPSSENYVPLTEGLTAEEAERVRFARLDDADMIVESLKRSASSPTSTITTQATKTVAKVGTPSVASPAPSISAARLSSAGDGTRETSVDFSTKEIDRERAESMNTKSSDSVLLAGPKMSGGALSDDDGKMKRVAFDGLKSKGGSLYPPSQLPLKGMQVSGPGTLKELPIIKKSIEIGFGIQRGAKIGTNAATKNSTMGFQQPLDKLIKDDAPIEDTRTNSVSEGPPDEVEYSGDNAEADAPNDDVVTSNNKSDKGAAADSFDKVGNEEAVFAPPLPRTDTDEAFSDRKWTAEKQIGTGASFAPKAFTPPESRPRPKSLEIVDAFIDLESANDDGMYSYSVQEGRQQKQPMNLWSGESFYGTASSRVYGLGSIRPSKSGGGVESPQESKDRSINDDAASTNTNKSDVKKRATVNNLNAGSEVEIPMEDPAVLTAWKKKEESFLKKQARERRRLEDEKRLIEEKERVAKLLADAEVKLARQLERMEEERRQTTAELVRAAEKIAEAESRILDLEVTRAIEVRSLEERLKEKTSLAKRQLKQEQDKYLEQARLRQIEEVRKVEEQNKLAQRILKERLAEEKVKSEVELSKTKQQLKEESRRVDLERARARADEEARWIQEQNALVQKRLDERIYEGKSKMNGETSCIRQKMKDDQEQSNAESRRVDEDEWVEKLNQLLEERLEERFAELKKENNSQATNASDDASSKSREFIPLNVDRIKVAGISAPSNLSTSSEPASADVLDALAADVEALQIVSLCEAEFDTKSPGSSVGSTSQREQREQRELAGELSLLYPFVSLLRDSSPYIVNHRHSTIVYHIPGDLISNVARFNSVMDDISLTYLFGMKIVICVGCRKQIMQRLGNKCVDSFGESRNLDVRVTDVETLNIIEEEAGFCRFEVERLLNRCLRNKGADCNVVSGCFITAKEFGVVDGVDYQVRHMHI
ncbi:hypothetical protein ACHAXA_006916 [Cyclostephanos tholiformis]|uniref:Uncharacterized protein n=1 Tax=Cyclostephanos tholiformis TaxID=382380 RepID=A0ABD3RTR2_9STRA